MPTKQGAAPGRRDRGNFYFAKTLQQPTFSLRNLVTQNFHQQLARLGFPFQYQLPEEILVFPHHYYLVKIRFFTDALAAG